MKVSTKTLTILIQNKENPIDVEFTDKINLLELLNANKIDISQSCGGFGTCTTCRVYVLNNLSSFSERTEIEVERAQERNFSDHERLCCQSIISESTEIRLPST